MLRYVIVLALATAALAEVPVLSCGGNIGERYWPRAVRSPHCADGICSVSLTAPIEFEIDATTPYDTPYINVHGNMYYKLPDNLEAVIPIPFPEEVMDGCRTLVGASCPLASGQEFTTRVFWDWQSDLEPELEPGTTFEMEFRIYDENEVIATCFRAPVILIE